MRLGFCVPNLTVLSKHKFTKHEFLVVTQHGVFGHTVRHLQFEHMHFAFRFVRVHSITIGQGVWGGGGGGVSQLGSKVENMMALARGTDIKTPHYYKFPHLRTQYCTACQLFRWDSSTFTTIVPLSHRPTFTLFVPLS